MLRNASFLTKTRERIEKIYGYDVIDDKNYNEVQPEKQKTFDFNNSSQPTSVALIPVLAKI